MVEFLFESWPNGPGPAIVQVLLILLGATAGIRILDDARRVLAALKARRSP
jgi:hypothetical protein